MFSKIIFKQIFKHKFITVIILILVITGGYFGYQKFTGNDSAVRYAIAAVEKGTLIVSVSGSGQVSSLNEADIKAQVNGEILNLYIANGDEVKEGKMVAKLDDTDLKKAVASAQLSLETAQFDLDQLLSPPDELDLFQAENALTKANDSKTKAEEGIENGLKDAFDGITNIFFDLPTIITTARDVLYGCNIAKSEIMISDYNWNETVYMNSFDSTDRMDLEPFIEGAKNDYKAARIKYDQNLKDYKDTDYYADSKTIENLLNETSDTTKAISQAIKSEINLLDFVVDYFSSHDKRIYSGITAYQTNLQSYYLKTNGYLQNLYSIQNSLKSDRQAVVDAELSVKEKELLLEKLKEAPDELAVRTKELAVQQRKDALASAQKDLEDSYIYAPFSGVIAEVKVKNGDSVSKGTVVANIITEQKIAEISLNEVDAANVKVGQKVTLTFDALSEANVSGKVIEVDTVGQVSQGVVNYGVKIAFGTDIEQVKPGMSVTADIITEAKQDVLVLSNSAIKSQEESYYVELVEAPEGMKQQLLANVSGTILPTPPKLQTVEIGLINDFSTEVVTGLQEGDIVVVSTINPSAVQTTQTKTNQTQGFQVPGMNTGGKVQMRNFSE